MTAITTEDGSRIFFKDWGSGQPVVLSHGWPLNSEAWESQMLFLGQHGYRVVAHDRRGHGRSTQTWDGNDMDTYADDLASLLDALDLNDVVLVGHSTGGGEVARYIGRHGTQRLAKAVLLDAVPPHLVKTATNPEGIPMEVFDSIRAGVRGDRAQYFYDFALPFYGYNRPGAKVSRGIVEAFWRLSMQCGIKACYDCIAAFSETDFTEDLQKFDIPTLVVHGDDDQIVPIGVGGLRSAKMIKGATLKIYKGAPHGLAQTRAEEFNSDLLSFIESGRTAAVAGSSPPASIH